MRRLKRRGQSGFTIIELLVASTVFSAVVLVALSSFVGIGRLFYKGATFTQNQQTLRTISENVSSDINQTTSVHGPTRPDVAPAANVIYYCFGSIRYTAILGQPLDSAAESQDRASKPTSGWSKFALLRDKLPGANSCASPFGTGATALSPDASEILGNRMRLNSFCVKPNPAAYGNLYDLRLDIVTGDNVKGLDFKSPTGIDADCSAPQIATCKADARSSQYCAENSLGTSANAVVSNVSPGPKLKFGSTQYLLTVNTSGAAGTVYVDGEVCGDIGSLCTKTYDAQPKVGGEENFQTVQVIASVNDPTHHQFDNWKSSNSCNKSKNSTCTFTINQDVSLTAIFK